MERLPSFRSCYFCGSENPRGLGIGYFHDAATDRVVGWVDPEGFLCGYPGILHGGVQSALLDDVIYWSVTHGFATTSVTLRLTTEFRAPARLGRRFALRAWVVGAGGRKVTARGVLENDEGSTVADAQGLYLLHPVAVFREQMLPHFDFSQCSVAVRAHYGVGSPAA